MHLGYCFSKPLPEAKFERTIDMKETVEKMCPNQTVPITGK